jgi:hypothetical protein
MARAKPKITKRDQKIVANILTQFMFTRDMDDVVRVWKEIFDEYELCEDPFTRTPCTPDEFCKNSLEYDRQVMIERYGHCDGLE